MALFTELVVLCKQGVPLLEFPKKLARLLPSEPARVGGKAGEEELADYSD